MPQVLADVALEMEAARAHGVASVKHLQVRGGATSIGGVEGSKYNESR